MLVLSRKLNEKLCIGDDIIVTIVRIGGNVVRLGIEAPADVRVRRQEHVEADAKANAERAAGTDPVAPTAVDSATTG
ncbi:MAG: carbon storage regulator [Hyphomicrobiaceae bacterium]|nr:MAG: carbon storage regulator [Hyphomicrobiaceae bacterium]